MKKERERKREVDKETEGEHNNYIDHKLTLLCALTEKTGVDEDENAALNYDCG